MKLVALLALAALAAGCGQSSQVGSGSASGIVAPTSQSTESQPQEDAGGPPDVLLDSAAGLQRGTLGSWCVQGSNVGACADSGPIAPESESVVAPGAELVLRLDGARVVRGADCHARDMSCVGEAHVMVPGCARLDVARIFLKRGEETRFRAPAQPGRYQVSVFAYFEADDGRTGDVSAVFGLHVKPGAEPTVQPIPGSSAGGTSPDAATTCR